jgi:hypothetical protein
VYSIILTAGTLLQSAGLCTRHDTPGRSRHAEDRTIGSANEDAENRLLLPIEPSTIRTRAPRASRAIAAAILERSSTVCQLKPTQQG